MEKIPEIESELRDRLGQIKKEWIMFCNIRVDEERTFNIPKETIEWLAGTAIAAKEPAS